MVLSGLLLAAVLLQSRQITSDTRELGDMLPIWKVEKDCLLSKKGDVTVAFRLTLPEIFTLSNDEYDALHQVWLKAIKVLPTGTILHKQDWFTRAEYKADFSDDRNFLARGSELHFNERPYLSHECFLMLTLKATDRKSSSSALSSLLRKNIVPPERIDRRHNERLLGTIGQFRRILDDSGFVGMQRLSAEELVGTKEEPGLLERYLFLPGENRDAVLKDIEFKPEWKVGENHCELYSMADVEDLPAICAPTMHYDKYSTDKTQFSVGFATPAGLLLPVNHIYNQYMVIADTPKTLKRLEAKRRRLQSLSMYSRENAIGRDATQEFLNEAISEARTPIKAHFNLLCWTDSREELKELRNQTASALAKMDAVPHQETNGAPQLWWAGLPGNAADLPENDCFETFAEQASCFLNMETAYRSSKSPFGIRLGDRLTGMPVHVDLSDEPLKRGVTTNRNKLVVGASGSGKSLFMNHLLHSYVQQGAHCVVVDVGHSYSGLCELLNGYYFTYSEENPIKFNPFFLSAGEVLDTEKKESIKTLLVALWKQNDESFRRSEYVAISNALQSYYQYLSGHPDIFPCFNSFYEFLQTDFIKQLEADRVKDRDFDMHNFLYVLRPFYKGGEFDYLLNAKENLDVLNQPFVVVELDNIKDHPILFPIVTLITTSLFISKMRKLQGVRKLIVIEEAWKAIAKGSMAEFMKYLYKTVRKHFGEAITVTQEIDDLIGSPIVKETIINNADCKIILDMKKFQNKFDAVQQVLGMTDKGRDLVLSINRANDPNYRYREIYTELGNQLMKVYRFEPSPYEYYAYTTEQSEKVRVQEYAKKYGSIQKGLAAMVADMKTN
ncbi:TraG family conjugative transposon ATPase [Parapedobacter sp. ISTM3]|nr:TraG family conjugative transposon ATPase [Parapedobacter sp. ISTM3]